MENEVWKPCFQYEGVYEVSNLGHVARLLPDGRRRNISSRYKAGKGHPVVSLRFEGQASTRRVCKIVAMAFLGAGENHIVMHLDGNKENNSVENLVSAEANDSMIREITHEILLERVLYVPETGEFFLRPNDRRIKRGATRTELTPFGCKKKVIHSNGKSYIQLSICRKSMLSHRVAWFYMTGRWPEQQIDHIDGDSLNNRFSNLRDCSAKENSRNKRYKADKPQEMIGVHFVSHRLWTARAGDSTVNCKTKEEAIAARKRLLVENGFHENHGKRRVE